MKRQNISAVDKIVRGVVGLLLVYLASSSYASARALSAVAFILGLYAIITSMFGVCLAYKLFGISTKHEGGVGGTA